MRRRPLAIAAVVTVVLSILVGMHYYLARRLVLDPGFAVALAWGIGAMGLTLLLQPVFERTLPRPFSLLLAWPASIWMGLFFLMLVTTAGSEVLFSLAGAGEAGVPAARIRAVAVLAVSFLAAGVALRNGLSVPAVKRREVELARWPRALDGFRIAQISDVHIGPLRGRRFAAEIVRRVNALDADLVAVTGDLVDGSVPLLTSEVEPFRQLSGRHGVFFVTGNHDVYSGTDPWVAKVRELGFRVLRNERVTIGEPPAAFDLAGVDDHHAHYVSGDQREDLDQALDGCDETRAVVLLAHDPSTFKRAHQRDVDLQLSGHTHGGQIWPFVHIVRLAVPWVAGFYEKNGSKLYVSRGTGFWGPPMRLFAPAEITELTLRAPRV